MIFSIVFFSLLIITIIRIYQKNQLINLWFLDIVWYIEKLKKYEFVTILNFEWFWPEICNSCNFGISIWRSKSISYFSLHLVLVLFHELPFLHSISANHYLSTVAVACTHFFYIVQIISCFELKEKSSFIHAL